MQIASRQGRTLREALRDNTSREFVLWKQFFLLEKNLFANAEFYYLARIAKEVAQLRMPNAKLRLDEFLLTFETPAVATDNEDDEEPTPEELEAATQRSKSAWFGVLGIQEQT